MNPYLLMGIGAFVFGYLHVAAVDYLCEKRGWRRPGVFGKALIGGCGGMVANLIIHIGTWLKS